MRKHSELFLYYCQQRVPFSKPQNCFHFDTIGSLDRDKTRKAGNYSTRMQWLPALDKL